MHKSSTIWQDSAVAALSWVQESIRATGGRGSAHHWSPIGGWSKAYPETTGYLIETLLDWSERLERPDLQTDAGACARWLLGVQLPSGAFPGGMVGGQLPSVFNTAMILFGLQDVRAWKTAANPKTEAADWPLALQANERAIRWLLDCLETDGSWQKAAYVPGFCPTYYTRAVWGVLKASQTLADFTEKNAHEEAWEKMQKALAFYARRFQPDGFCADWGFAPRKPAFTHTIAYTLEGFWESACLLQEAAVLEKTLFSLEKILAIRQKLGRLPGRFGENGQPDISFRCLTGNAQLSILCHRVWEKTGDATFQTSALALLEETLPFQCRSQNRAKNGALAGSAPFWGPYLRFRYPNWAAKFWLDALANTSAMIASS